jgi:hypothetical protein
VGAQVQKARQIITAQIFSIDDSVGVTGLAQVAWQEATSAGRRASSRLGSAGWKTGQTLPGSSSPNA